MKQIKYLLGFPSVDAAAFRRLCVETWLSVATQTIAAAAAFRRLCVETNDAKIAVTELLQPPSGGCVLKQSL